MVVKGKVDEINDYDSTLKKNNIDIQEYRRRIHDLEEELSLTKRRDVEEI